MDYVLLEKEVIDIYSEIEEKKKRLNAILIDLINHKGVGKIAQLLKKDIAYISRIKNGKQEWLTVEQLFTLNNEILKKAYL